MTDPNTGLPADPASLSWGGLTECILDEIASLRQSAEYARSTAYKDKVDSLTYCARTLVRRLEGLGAVPSGDEPAFILLARDPAAPGLLRAWADDRELTQPPRPEKVAQARARATEMELWRAANKTALPPLAADTTGGQLGQGCSLVRDRQGPG